MLFNVVYHSGKGYYLCPPPPIGRREQDDRESCDLLGACVACPSVLQCSPAVWQSGPWQEVEPTQGLQEALMEELFTRVQAGGVKGTNEGWWGAGPAMVARH